MKKLSLICMTLLAFFAMASCRGPQGPQGPAGQDGNANVSSSTVTVKSRDWEWSNQNCQWMVEIDYPAINSNVFNYGAVLVYMDVDGSWNQVPLTYSYQDVITYDDVDEIIDKVKAAGYEVFVEPNDKVILSEPEYPIRMAFCFGPLGEQIEFFCER